MAIHFLIDGKESGLNNKACHIAAENGWVTNIEWLLIAADPRGKFPEGRNVVSHAAQHGHANIIERCEKWYEDRCNAVHNLDAEELSKARTGLLRPRIDPQVLQTSTMELLARAATSLCQLPYNRGDGRTPMHWAAIHGHVGVVEQLLKWYEIDIDLPDFSGVTPLWEAVRNNKASVVELLIQNGADVRSSDSPKMSLLGAAAGDGHTEALSSLLKRGDRRQRQRHAWTNPTIVGCRAWSCERDRGTVSSREG